MVDKSSNFYKTCNNLSQQNIEDRKKNHDIFSLNSIFFDLQARRGAFKFVFRFCHILVISSVLSYLIISSVLSYFSHLFHYYFLFCFILCLVMSLYPWTGRDLTLVKLTSVYVIRAYHHRRRKWHSARVAGVLHNRRQWIVLTVTI